MDLETLTPQEFEKFRELIYRSSGNRVDASKVMLVSNRIRRRLRAANFPDFQSYYRFLVSPAGKAEMDHFLDAVTTNETFFFRTPAHFEWFRDQFLAEATAPAAAGGEGRSLRVWSAACSSGEEAYSLGICLAENQFRLRDFKCTVVGTDISHKVIKEAREGVYKARALEETPEPVRQRYFDFDPQAQTWAVRPAVKKMVEFRWHNLMEPFRTSPFDCIFIRNVLIYFDRASKQRVLDHLLAALNRGGYLVVGPSEGIYDMLEPLQKRGTFLYQKP